jgi:hypothetical protein
MRVAKAFVAGGSDSLRSDFSWLAEINTGYRVASGTGVEEEAPRPVRGQIKRKTADQRVDGLFQLPAFSP